MSAARRIVAAVVALIALPVVVLVMAIIVVAVFGVSIDASRWRDALAARASVALGRPVAFDGPLALELGRETALHVGGARILNPPGFATQELGTLGKARLRIDLLELLRGRLHVRAFEAVDGRLRLERAADGARTGRRRRTCRPERIRRAARPGRRSNSRSRACRSGISRSNMTTGARAQHHFFDVDELAAIGKWSQPLKLTLTGRVSKTFPYSIHIEGGSAQAASGGARSVAVRTRLRVSRHASACERHGDAAVARAGSDFGAGTEDLKQIEGFWQTRSPDLGAAALSGRMIVGPTAVEMRDLHDARRRRVPRRPRARFGSLRWRVSGELAIATLDVRPFLDTAPDRPEKQLTYTELTHRHCRCAASCRSMATWSCTYKSFGLPVEVRDARVEVHADERGLARRSPQRSRACR